MHIVVIGTKGIPNIIGGVEKHAEEIYPRIVAMGHKVTIFRWKKPDNSYTKEFKGVRIIDISTFSVPIISIIYYNIVSFIYSLFLKPDILHIHNAGPSIFALPARIFRIKVVFTAHIILSKKTFREKLVNISEKIGIKFSHKVICVANYISETFKKRYNYHDAVHIPNGISYSNEIYETSYIRSLGLIPDNYIIVVGRFVPIKGFDLIFEVLPEIKKAGLDLVFIGDTLYETEYSRYVKERAGKEGIVLTGFVTGSKLEELYSNARLFLQPSYQEGNSLALLDAIGHKLEILVSDIEANREIGIEETNMFESGNVKDFRIKLKNILSRNSTESCMWKIDVNYFNWDTIANSTFKVYNDLIKNE